jgi:ribosomal protein S18 acetylase RimI-like enzyme
MGIVSSISRLTEYYKRHGFGATIRRAGLTVKRALFSSRMVIFYCDIDKRRLPPVHIPKPLRVTRLKTPVELRVEHLQEMTSFWNPRLARRNIVERFEKGASLWLITSGDRLAGYGWTLQGRTMEPYFLPLGNLDVHLFDFHVFSQYRGQGLNPLLVSHILYKLAAEGGCRAFIEAAEWNEAQLSSLGKTPFRRLGLVRKLPVFGHTFVMWADRETVQQVSKVTEGKENTLGLARSHEQ